MGTADHVYLKEEEKGIVPRSITDIFSAIEAKKMHMNIAVSVSFIEVYKEDVRDLLDPGEGREFLCEDASRLQKNRIYFSHNFGGALILTMFHTLKAVKRP